MRRGVTPLRGASNGNPTAGSLWQPQHRLLCGHSRHRSACPVCTGIRRPLAQMWSALAVPSPTYTATGSVDEATDFWHAHRAVTNFLPRSPLRSPIFGHPSLIPRARASARRHAGHILPADAGGGPPAPPPLRRPSLEPSHFVSSHPLFSPAQEPACPRVYLPGRQPHHVAAGQHGAPHRPTVSSRCPRPAARA